MCWLRVRHGAKGYDLPYKTAHKLGSLEGRPISWPVSSIVARRLKPALVVVVVLALGVAGLLWLRSKSGTTPNGAPVSDDRPSRGGGLIASIRSEPAGYNRYVEPSA